MPWFSTSYKTCPTSLAVADFKPGQYGSHLWARSWTEARRFARCRRIGERVLGIGGRQARPPHPLASQLLARRSPTKHQALEAVHALAWLGYLALQSRVARPFEVIGDQGFLHEAIHSLAFGYPRAPVLEAVRRIERLIPGYAGPRSRHRS